MSKYRSAVLFGEELEALYNDAKQNEFALPAVNVVSSETINATMEAAARVNSPVIIQFGSAGAAFMAGQGIPAGKFDAVVAGAVSGALHVHNLAEYYGVPVVLHTDHAARKWLPWLNGVMDAGEQFFKEKGQPLFSSHVLDLSEEPINENINTCTALLQRMKPLGMGIEIELCVTGGQEDDMDNRDVENSKLYTQPEDVAYAYKQLHPFQTRRWRSVKTPFSIS